MALIDKLRAIGDGFRLSRETTKEFTLEEMAVLAAEKVGTSFVSDGSPRVIENVVNISAVASVECEDILLFHSVESVSGASYGFSKNSNGYYVSNNKGENSSYAICKVALWAREETTVTLNCINYAESNYDYGLISEIDTMLELSSSADSSGVFKSFNGQSSQDVVQVVISVPAGDHYFCVKFIKDSSGANGNDTFQFAIVE